MWRSSLALQFLTYDIFYLRFWGRAGACIPRLDVSNAASRKVCGSKDDLQSGTSPTVAFGQYLT
jgi:hypothetical protein